MSARGYHAAELQQGLQTAHHVLRMHCTGSTHQSDVALEQLSSPLLLSYVILVVGMELNAGNSCVEGAAKRGTI